MSAEAMELVYHAQPRVRETACQEILGKCEPNVGGAKNGAHVQVV